MNQNLLSRVLEFLRRKMWNRRWQKAVTCLAAVAVFGVTYALILPAITMTKEYPTLEAEKTVAWSGDDLSVKVKAESEAGTPGRTVVLTLEGEGADLSGSYVFNEEGICLITDDADQEIELHRSIREKDAKNASGKEVNLIDYWFTLEAGQATSFTLNLIDEVDAARFAEMVEAVRTNGESGSEEIATASDAGKSTAVAKASGSNAQKASVSNADVAEANGLAEKEEEKIVTESNDNGFGEILDGAVVNDLEGDDEDEEQTETVAELKISAGIGDDYDSAVIDAAKNAGKRRDENAVAEVKLQWQNVIAEKAAEVNLISEVDGATIAVFYDSTAGIPVGSYLEVAEIEEGLDEYAEYLEKAGAAIAKATDSDASLSPTFARFFDITILDADGNEVEPLTPVNVVIAYDEKIGVAENADLKVVHFDDKKNQIKVIAPKDVDDETEVGALRFTADSFSVYGIVGMGEVTEILSERKITAQASDGASVTITGKIPEGAEAVIKPVTLTKEQMNAYFGESAVKGMDQYVIYDICIMVDGAEWQPEENVSVVVTNPAVSTKESNEEVNVTHIKDEHQTAEKVESSVNADGDITFNAESFSLYGFFTYTVDYYYGDKEYHMPGGTSMKLSELFNIFNIDVPITNVKAVAFTNEDLLKIERAEADWDLISLVPFDTEELLTVTLADDSLVEIVVLDAPTGAKAGKTYPALTFDEDYLKLFAGPFEYRSGRYDIFGGGNGIPTAVKEDEFRNQTSYGGHWTGQVNYVTQKRAGKAVGVDGHGQPLVPEDGKFKSGSRGTITWNGDLTQAFFSFGCQLFNGSKGLYTVDLYGPGYDNNPAAHTQVTINAANWKQDPREEKYGQYIGQHYSWKYLTFDATQFVSCYGEGDYTVVVTIENEVSVTFADMGWTIYGVSTENSRPYSAVVGLVQEATIANHVSSINGGHSVSAAANFSSAIVPKGPGKAWFNVHGGEKAYPDSTLSSYGGYADWDYLEVKTQDEGEDGQVVEEYVKLGTHDGISGTIPVPGWDCEDIAQPNTNQTAPADFVKYDNRFSFGLATFNSGITDKKILGVRKSMKTGNDVFGSMMLLAEYLPTDEEHQEHLKKLDLEGNGLITGLTHLGANEVFTFNIAPHATTPNAPMPKNKAGEIVSTVTAQFAAGDPKDKTLVLNLGYFTFDDARLYKYLLTEQQRNADNWGYSNKNIILTADVQPGPDFTLVADYTLSVEGEEGEDATFVNKYTYPVQLELTKKNKDGEVLPGAEFEMYYLDGNDKVQAGGSPATTDGNGKLLFTGLSRDNHYFIKETAAPAGYKDDETITEVYYNGTSWVYKEGSDGTETAFTVADNTLTVEDTDTKALGTLFLNKVNERKSFDVHLWKVGEIIGTSDTNLQGAKFSLQRKATEGGTYAVYTGDPDHPDGAYETDADGRFTMKLEEGYYQMTETAAPAGYIITHRQFEFRVVDQQGDKVVYTDTTDGDITFDQATMTFKVKNKAGQSLPNTGGPGAALYTLSGMMLLICSALLYGFRRRHEERRSA